MRMNLFTDLSKDLQNRFLHCPMLARIGVGVPAGMTYHPALTAKPQRQPIKPGTHAGTQPARFLQFVLVFFFAGNHRREENGTLHAYTHESAVG